MSERSILHIVENVVSRVTHDLLSPFTAITNGLSIMSSRLQNKEKEENSPLSLEKLFEIINISMEQIFNQIDAIKYMYMITRERYLLPVEKFVDDWNKILKKDGLKIQFSENFSKIYNDEAKLISHLLFFLGDFVQDTNLIKIEKMNDAIHIVSVATQEDVIKRLINKVDVIDQFNINVYIFQLLLDELNYRITTNDMMIVLEKINNS